MPNAELKDIAIELSDTEREALADSDEDTDTPVVEGGDEPEAASPAASTPADDEPSSSGPAVPAPASEDEAAAAAAADTPPAEEVIPKLHLPQIEPGRLVPADLDEQLGKLDADVSALDKRYFEDGELEAREYQKQMRLLADRRTDLLSIKQEAALVQRTNEASRTAHWQTAQAKFFDDHAEFTHPVMHGALDSALRALYADAKYAGADYGYLLNKAANMVHEAIAVATGGTATPAPAGKPAAAAAAPIKQTPAAATATARAAKAKATIAAVPKTLGGLPTAEANPASGDEFSHLDNLSGMDLELALAKMTPEQESRFLESRG